RFEGRNLSVIVYDAIDPVMWQFLPSWVDANRPDWVLYIGAMHHHDRPFPPVDVLTEIGRRHPLVHLCCDGAEPVWWPLLTQYYANKTFALQLTIDGTHAGPIGDQGLIALCPIDPSSFPVKSWASRAVELGFGGGVYQRGR